MTKTDALKALDDAFATRVDRMYQILADSFSGSVNARTTAETNFTSGIGHSLEAFEFAACVIGKQIKD